jgi:hypothetical protein
VPAVWEEACEANKARQQRQWGMETTSNGDTTINQTFQWLQDYSVQEREEEREEARERERGKRETKQKRGQQDKNKEKNKEKKKGAQQSLEGRNI